MKSLLVMMVLVLTFSSYAQVKYDLTKEQLLSKGINIELRVNAKDVKYLSPKTLYDVLITYGSGDPIGDGGENGFSIVKYITPSQKHICKVIGSAPYGYSTAEIRATVEKFVLTKNWYGSTFWKKVSSEQLIRGASYKPGLARFLSCVRGENY